MKLFEARNGFGGCSCGRYVRSYVWAEDEKRARELAHESLGEDPLEIIFLFDSNDEEFATKRADYGWERH